MFRTLACTVAALGLSGCAYIPDLETEDTFSYAEIVNQVECETHQAIERLQALRDPEHPEKLVYEWADLDNWAMGISITPSVFADAQLNVGSTHKGRPDKSGNFLQWALGGTAAAPGGFNLEGYGSSAVSNKYQLNILALYNGKKDKAGKFVFDGNRRINDMIKCVTPTQPAIPQNAFRGGYFGIEKFLDRSLAATGNLTVEPTTLGYTKEYRERVQLGVTPGWYTALGNTSSAVGAYAYLDNIIGLTFTPPTRAAVPKPIEVIIVGAPGKPVAAKPGRPVVANTARVPAVSGLKLEVPPVSAGQSERLLNGQNNLLTNQILRSVSPLLEQQQ